MKRFLSLICLLLTLTTVFALSACDNTPVETSAVTKAPATNAPATNAPETNAPETNAPVTNAPETNAPASTAAETNAPATTAPADAADVVINTAAELRAFAEGLNSGDEYYEDAIISINADIDLAGENWKPIDGANLLMCTIEGNNHVINNMTITAADIDEGGYGYGFIGKMPNEVTIQNITFANARIEPTSKHAACVIGDLTNSAYLTNVTVDNLFINGGIGTWGDTAGICFRVGGLIGCATGGYPEVSNCTVKNSKLIGYHNIAGLVGCLSMDNFLFENNTVESCFFQYSAGFSDTYDAGVARYFADPFYCVTNEWETYHYDVDIAEGNKAEKNEYNDIAYEITYKDNEGKTADYDGDFPV